jgi:hypothetical protein
MNFSPEKVFTLRSQIIKTVAFLLGILVVANGLIYDIFGKLYSIREFKESASMACGQLGVSYETTISSLTEAANWIGLFDFTDFSVEAEPGKTYEFLTSVDRKLSSVAAMNKHILSVYIYLEEPDWVFDSRRIPAIISPLENFLDREIFPVSYSGSIRRIGPRMLVDPIPDRGSYTVITLISPMVIRNTGRAYLAVNINTDTLYTDLAKSIKLPGGFTFYAYNADNAVILHSSDKSKLYSTIDPASLSGGGGGVLFSPEPAGYRNL